MQNIYKHDKFHGKNIDIVARLYGVAACPFCQCKFQFDQPFIEPFILYCKNCQNAIILITGGCND